MLQVDDGGGIWSPEQQRMMSELNDISHLVREVGRYTMRYEDKFLVSSKDF